MMMSVTMRGIAMIDESVLVKANKIFVKNNSTTMKSLNENTMKLSDLHTEYRCFIMLSFENLNKISL